MALTKRAIGAASFDSSASQWQALWTTRSLAAGSGSAAAAPRRSWSRTAHYTSPRLSDVLRTPAPNVHFRPREGGRQPNRARLREHLQSTRRWSRRGPHRRPATARSPPPIQSPQCQQRPLPCVANAHLSANTGRYRCGPTPQLPGVLARLARAHQIAPSSSGPRLNQAAENEARSATDYQA